MSLISTEISTSPPAGISRGGGSPGAATGRRDLAHKPPEWGTGLSLTGQGGHAENEHAFSYVQVIWTKKRQEDPDIEENFTTNSNPK